MADLIVRRGGLGGGDIDPVRLVQESMRRIQDLMRVDPFLEMGPVPLVNQASTFVPDFEVRETRDGIVLRADVPGVSPENLEITVADNRLRISGKREIDVEERGDTWYAAERAYGSFTRVFVLPEGVDTSDVQANVENGVLTIQVGKREESQPRRIAVGQQASRRIGQDVGQQGGVAQQQQQAQQQSADIQDQQPASQQQREPEKV